MYTKWEKMELGVIYKKYRWGEEQQVSFSLNSIIIN